MATLRQTLQSNLSPPNARPKPATKDQRARPPLPSLRQYLQRELSPQPQVGPAAGAMQQGTQALAGGNLLAGAVGDINQQHRDRALGIARSTAANARTLGGTLATAARDQQRQAAVADATSRLQAAVEASPRMRAGRQLGAQNMAGIQGDPRLLGPSLVDEAGNVARLDAPAANMHRQMQQIDPAGPYSGLSSAYTPERLTSTGTPLNLARTPVVPGEGVTDAIAYNPGAAGSSPFVSDGPLSGGPRGQVLQGRLDRMKQQMGIAAPSTPMAGGSQLPSERRIGQLGTLAQATRDGGIRLIGPVAQQTLARTGMTADALAAQRDNIIGGTPTTFVDNGDGVRNRLDIRALHPEQQPNMDLRGQRNAQVRDFLTERGRLGRLLAQAPTTSQEAGVAAEPAALDPQLGTMVNNTLSFRDAEGNAVESSQLDMALAQANVDRQIQDLTQMVDAGTLTEQQAVERAAELERQNPTGNYTSLLKSVLSQKAQQAASAAQARERALRIQGQMQYGAPMM